MSGCSNRHCRVDSSNSRVRSALRIFLSVVGRVLLITVIVSSSAAQNEGVSSLVAEALALANRVEDPFVRAAIIKDS